MRLRNNPEADIILMNSKYVIKDIKPSYFTNDNPVHLEIGCGKGGFIIGMALKYPEINFIAVEKYATVLVKTLEKLEKANLDNVLLLHEDALELPKYFTAHSMACIYINFSDPWPKSRHEKRRLTYKTFLDSYKLLLSEDGLLKQKTDNVSLFESSICSFNSYPVKIEYISLDLHKSELAQDNVMSEYEQKFSSLNQPIFSAWLSFRKEE